MTAVDPPPPPLSLRIIKGIFWAQLGIAAFLVGSDLLRALPVLVSPSDAPALTAPIGPGDQTRRYRPGAVPQRTASPDTRPIPATGDMPDRLDMEMTVWKGKPTITLTGTIADGDADRFATFLEDQSTKPEVVFLDSPGGSVFDALTIGRKLREIGVATEMGDSDVCLSACPYILASGTTRTVAPGAWVGVHQGYYGENTLLPAFLAVSDIQRAQGEVMEYLIDMGIDPALMRPALATPPDEIYLLTPEEMTAYNLTTSAEDS